MKYKLFLVCVWATIVSHAQQISIDDTLTPEELIETVLFQGCIDVSNVSSSVNGSVDGLMSYGYFESANSNFPFNNGIVLTTGDVNASGNPFNTNALNNGTDNWGTDSDLENVLGVSNTLNATVIEFDVVAASNQINFNYILASEEYLNDYPCNYSDSFGFLIRPNNGSAPYTNITLIPGTNTNVSTQNIRPNIVGFCDALNEEYFEGYNVGDTNYNGRTTILTATADIVPNTSYHIKLVIADQFDENFDSAVFIEGNTFTQELELGNTISTCDASLELDTEIDNPEAIFEWYYNGTLLSDNTPAIIADQTGNYEVVVTIPYGLNQCVISDTISVTVDGDAMTTEVDDFELCEESFGSNTATFNLTNYNAVIATSVDFTNPSIEYYYTLSDAENGANEITAAIQNTTNPQALVAKVIDPVSGCVGYTPFNIVVNSLPDIIDPDELQICEETGVTTGFFDLSIAGNQTIGNTNNLEVAYYESLNEAENNLNPITDLNYESQVADQIIYIKATDTITSCSNLTTVTLHVNQGPDLLMDEYDMDACYPQGSGFAIFDLTSILEHFVQDTSVYNITFYPSLADAENNNNPITDPANFNNSVEDTQSIYVSIVDPVTGCASIARINVYAAVLSSETNRADFYTCDDITNDEVEEFDLSYVATYIANGLGDVTVTFYATENDMNNEVNPIDQTVPYFNTTNPQQLYITISNDDDCIFYDDINLVINPYFEVTGIPNQTYCDDNSDGFTTVMLEDFTETIINGNDYTVKYYISEDDANNQSNPITLFTNTTNPQTIWAVVTDEEGICSDVIDFEIEVLSAPDTNTLNDMQYCDDNDDGIYNVNLNDVIPQLISDTTDVTIEFYTSENDAVDGTNMITTPSNFNTSTTNIYVKSINDLTGCYNIQSYTLYITYFPDLTAENSNFTVCESDGDGIEAIYLENYDAAIAQGVVDVEVLYFESQNDADLNINPIDKNSAYFNTTDPQLIYVRRHSIYDNDCARVDLINIHISDYPEYDAPNGLFLCDDISNDGFADFTLTDAFTTSTLNNPNLTITFHENKNEAENNLNSLDSIYTNNVNPKTIWSRIETTEGCYQLEAITLNVVSVGQIQQPSPISYCDDDENGFEIVDLTGEDVEVLMIRQNNIDLAYYETEQDAINGTNPITDPENYSVSVGNGTPTTVYITATNTNSLCSLYVPLQIYIYEIPQFNKDTTLDICAENVNRLHLADLNDLVIDDADQFTFSYYYTYANAVAETNALGNNINLTNSTVTLYVRAENIVSGCSNITNVTVNLLQKPGPFSIDDISTCALDITAHTINLTQNLPTLITNNPDLVVSYHTTQLDAENNMNAITSPQTYVAHDDERIFVRVESSDTGCFAIPKFDVILYRRPTIPLDNTYVICTEGGSIVVDAYTGYPEDTYVWQNNATTSAITISEPGTYGVTVTSPDGCTNTKYFGVNESESAFVVDVETTSFSDNNSITIQVSGSGIYEFSLDGGPFQSSNVFEDVQIGYHSVEITDLKGCDATIIDDIVILGFPKYFTPNGDGVNDQWSIFGFETLSDSYITIFDRYGKLIKVINHGDEGWDGTFNGHMLPSNDYWFEATINDGVEEPFVFRSHFTLKR
ncbi:T9SS type B sorting domain-containing protein [Neptunitalea lumnitzerae]|uniref:Gliding motility-associated C-terminal domain-containing protein n=1 Tax=Neptunitalea lumnitzerae TaxID=2965509 RepID=A0ABQ5MKL0_9FLAO|nr:choice-of-anchor L domain-containing protein [Neptunitalea sp. Y10]GLB49943.1 hypothetical protein Y10_23110 [Neptunitalea sp. Y10]